MRNSLVVGLTYDLITDYPVEEGAPKDVYGEFDSEETLERLESGIRSLGYSVRRIGNMEKLVSFLANKQTVDIVFNIAEGRWGRDREAQIPSLLEAHRIPYTFSDPLTLGICLDKALTKRLWELEGLPVAPFCEVQSVDDFNAPIEAGLEFPMFVKPVREGSSIGVRLESVVENADQLKEQVKRVIHLYNQPALVEEFLSGREFTVAILDFDGRPKVLGALEVTKAAVTKVNGFEQKNDWATYGPIAFKPLDESPLKEYLAEICLHAYQVMGCRDAARIDLRMDKHGNPQLMEINALSGLSEHSALPIIAANAGYSFEALIDQILQNALLRSKLAGKL
jgi:D-alanine-D-alanine ligase